MRAGKCIAQWRPRVKALNAPQARIFAHINMGLFEKATRCSICGEGAAHGGDGAGYKGVHGGKLSLILFDDPRIDDCDFKEKRLIVY
jgi:hypothetical protein